MEKRNQGIKFLHELKRSCLVIDGASEAIGRLSLLTLAGCAAPSYARSGLKPKEWAQFERDEERRSSETSRTRRRMFGKAKVKWKEARQRSMESGMLYSRW